MGEMHDMYGDWENGEYNPFEGEPDDIGESQDLSEYNDSKSRFWLVTMAIYEETKQKYGGTIPRPPSKPLVLSYEMTWRTPEQKKFMKSVAWKRLRIMVFERDNYTCSYCGIQPDKSHRQVNHVNGDPNDNSFENLETVCNQCHMILHSGLWARVYPVIDIYEKSEMPQEQVILTTREMREQGFNDEEIIAKCGLIGKVPWKQNQKYLSNKIGFISSRKVFPTKK